MRRSKTLLSAFALFAIAGVGAWMIHSANVVAERDAACTERYVRAYLSSDQRPILVPAGQHCPAGYIWTCNLGMHTTDQACVRLPDTLPQCPSASKLLKRHDDADICEGK